MAVVVVRNRLPVDFGKRYTAIPRAYDQAEWDRWHLEGYGEGGDDQCRFPHCDSEVLHAPGECAVCDLYPRRQLGRVDAKVAFSGHPPAPGWSPCPADVRRPPGASNWHGRWGGNAAAGSGEVIEWATSRADVVSPGRGATLLSPSSAGTTAGSAGGAGSRLTPQRSPSTTSSPAGWAARISSRIKSWLAGHATRIVGVLRRRITNRG